MRRRLLAPLLVAVVALAGCGGSADASPLEIVRATSAKTEAADSAKVAIAIDTTVDQERTSFTGEGSFDFAGRKGTLTLDLGTLLAGTSLEVRLLGDVIYAAVPAAAVSVLGGKKFLKIDIKALAASNEQFKGLSSGTDPLSGVAALRGVKDVTEVGEEQVRGEATTHYRGSVDLAAAKAELDGDAAASVDSLIDLLDNTTVPFEVWIDDAGRTRRTSLAVDLPASAKTGNKPTSTKIVTELYDFGTAVSVEAPPESEVADGNAFLSGVAGGIGG